jgi:hypothetical protein
MALGFLKMCKMLGRADTVVGKLTIPPRVYLGDSERYSVYTFENDDRALGYQLHLIYTIVKLT